MSWSCAVWISFLRLTAMIPPWFYQLICAVLQSPNKWCRILSHLTASWNLRKHLTASYNILQHLEISGNILQHHAFWNILQHLEISGNILQHLTTPYNILQHLTTSYSILQHLTASYILQNILQLTTSYRTSCRISSQYIDQWIVVNLQENILLKAREFRTHISSSKHTFNFNSVSPRNYGLHRLGSPQQYIHGQIRKQWLL